MRTLIVIDMQNDFVTGSLANKAAADIIPFIKAEIESGNYSRILFTQDTHYKEYLETQEGKNLPIVHCEFGTDGWQIVDDLKRYAINGSCAHKETFGYLGWANPKWGLYDVDEIVLVGTCTDICVVSNALLIKALYPEKKLSVLAKGCAGLTPEKHAAALEVMKSCQINVID